MKRETTEPPTFDHVFEKEKAEIYDCKIDYFDMGFEDHGLFTIFLRFDGDGWWQGMPGICLGSRSSPPTNKGMQFLMGLLNTLEKSTINKLVGTKAKVQRVKGDIVKIGHATKGTWIDLRDYFNIHLEER